MYRVLHLQLSASLRRPRPWPPVLPLLDHTCWPLQVALLTTIFNMSQCFPEIIVSLIGGSWIDLCGEWLGSIFLLGAAGALGAAALCYTVVQPPNLYDRKSVVPVARGPTRTLSGEVTEGAPSGQAVEAGGARNQEGDSLTLNLLWTQAPWGACCQLRYCHAIILCFFHGWFCFYEDVVISQAFSQPSSRFGSNNFHMVPLVSLDRLLFTGEAYHIICWLFNTIIGNHFPRYV